MRTRQEVLSYGLRFPDTYKDTPFHDDNWELIRYRKNKKAFAWVYEYEGTLRVNVKADPQWRDFWRQTYRAVIPGYHQNKEHWNTIILDGTIPDGEVKRMIAESYDLIVGNKGRETGREPGNRKRRSDAERGSAMQKQFPGKVQDILEKFTNSAVRIFGQELTGVYLHGSLAMNCFNPDKSDIDLIVVVEGGVADGQKMRFMEDVVELNRAAPGKGIEMSVVRRAYCGDFVYPTPYELHFSPAHLDWFQREPQEYIRRMNGTDKDLAAHFTIINHCGMVLEGAQIEEVFAQVPREDYVDSILCDIENAGEDVVRNPVYIILNLCRVLAFLEEELVLSKLQGGEWGAEKLPSAHRSVIQSAVQCYTSSGRTQAQPDQAEAGAFCDYMLERIRGRIRS